MVPKFDVLEVGSMWLTMSQRGAQHWVQTMMGQGGRQQRVDELTWQTISG